MHQRDGTAARGMVASQHPLAVQAALGMLDAGGTAADAAVAAAAVLTVVDPRSTGLGGDLFALYWPRGAERPLGLAAAGVSPATMSLESLREAGYDRMPADGPWTVTVPGAPAGWETLLRRFGALERKTVLEPAITLARDGFDVTPIVAEEWASTVDKLLGNEAATAAFLFDGKAPAPGDRVVLPDLADTLATFADEGARPFYQGALAERIAGAVAALGGPLRASDLSAWVGPEWVEPLRISFRGLDVYELPPPGQGLVVLEALRIYEGMRADGPVDEDHAAIEAVKLAYDDANAHLGDPAVTPVPVDRLLSEEHVGAQRGRIRGDTTLPAAVGRPSDTVYVAVADAQGGACSFIQSVYDGFGSGVVVPGTGITLHNRAAGFAFRAGHPNAVAPRKRPFHTIIPGMLGHGSAFRGCLGVVGGYMQAQGHLQVLRNILDRGMSPQDACDAPRFRVYRDREVALERGYPEATAEGLRARGHHITELSRFEGGGAQVLLRDEEGFRGGSDRRKDGVVGVR